MLEGVVSIVVMMPVPLSYFSPLVGGLPGATPWVWNRRTTGTRSSPDARHWLAEHTQPGETIAVRRRSRTPGSICARSGALPGGWPRSIAAFRNGTCFKTGRVPFPPSTGRWSRSGQPAYTVTKLGVP